MTNSIFAIENLIQQSYQDDSNLHFRYENQGVQLNFKLSAAYGDNQLTLLASEIRDFSPLDYLTINQLQQLGEFLAELINKHRPCRIKLGPAKQHNLTHLKTVLEQNSDFVWSVDSNAIEPMITLPSMAKLYKKHKASEKKYHQQQFKLVIGEHLPIDEVKQRHQAKWGNNRNDKFFEFLNALSASEYGRTTALYAPDQQLIGVNLDIILPDKTLFYFCANNTLTWPDSGKYILLQALKAFEQQSKPQSPYYYSMGRGGEQYKYRFANSHQLLYDLKGFYQGTSKPLA